MSAVATVMVCDDSPLIRENLRRAVAGVAGVGRVVGASSGEEVLTRWTAERPALVLMDVRMPGIGGVEAARRLLARHPGAGVLMLTVAEDVEGVARAVAAGARGYVVKDATRSELVAAVIGAIGDPSGRGRGARRGAQQRRDRQAAVPVRGHRQDPRPPAVPQAGRGRPRPGRGQGLPPRHGALTAAAPAARRHPVTPPGGRPRTPVAPRTIGG